MEGRLDRKRWLSTSKWVLHVGVSRCLLLISHSTFLLGFAGHSTPLLLISNRYQNLPHSSILAHLQSHPLVPIASSDCLDHRFAVLYREPLYCSLSVQASGILLG